MENAQQMPIMVVRLRPRTGLCVCVCPNACAGVHVHVRMDTFDLMQIGISSP